MTITFITKVANCLCKEIPSSDLKNNACTKCEAQNCV